MCYDLDMRIFISKSKFVRFMGGSCTTAMFGVSTVMFGVSTVMIDDTTLGPRSDHAPSKTYFQQFEISVACF